MWLKSIEIKDIKGLRLLYRGSRDGWFPPHFQIPCCDFSPTINLYQIEDGDCIGGYTELSWHPSSMFRAFCKLDNNARLFNVTSR